MYTNKIALLEYDEYYKNVILVNDNTLSLDKVVNAEKYDRIGKSEIYQIIKYNKENVNNDLASFISDFNKKTNTHSIMHRFFNQYTTRYNKDYDFFYVLGRNNEEYLSCKGSNNNIDIKVILLYEIVQGLLINLFLHDVLPHFIITYGLKISGPSFFQSAFPDDILAITGHDIPKNTHFNKIIEQYYSYQEYLEGNFLKTLLNDLSVEDFLNIYYQIVLLLETAQRKVSFVYYGSLYSNLLVQKLPKQFPLKYYRNNNSKVEFMTTNLIRLINYHEVYQKIDDKIYSKNNIYQEKRFDCFHDIYYFLLELICDIIRFHSHRKDLIEICRYFMDYFNNVDSLEDIIDVQLFKISQMYIYPVKDININSDINIFSSFINYCYKKYPIKLHKNIYNQVLTNEYKYKNLYDTWNIINNFSFQQLLTDYKLRENLVKEQLSKIIVATDVKNTFMYMDLYYKYEELNKKDRPAHFMNLKNEILLLIKQLLNDNDENEEFLRIVKLSPLMFEVKDYNNFNFSHEDSRKFQ